jgi:hypothetical protein
MLGRKATALDIERQGGCAAKGKFFYLIESYLTNAIALYIILPLSYNRGAKGSAN